MIKPSMCLGCGACAASCPKKAIILKINDIGFLVPDINKELCVNCNICHNVCKKVFSNSLLKPSQKLFLAQNIPQIEKQSSSGGVFYSLADYTLRTGGVVYAASLKKIQSNFECLHVCATDKQQIFTMLGSKYIQSNSYMVFSFVKKDLEIGKIVLFVGTPCQVNALLIFLNKDYPNLICADLLCYGIMSKKVFDLYIEKLKKDNNSNAEAIYFRKKEYGSKHTFFSIEFSNGTTHNEGSCDHPEGLMNLFARTLTIKQSCLQCPFKNKDRVGDLTLGDFPFSASNHYISGQFDSSRNISLVSVQTQKGINILCNCGLTIDVCNPTIINSVIAYKPNKKSLFSNLKIKHIISKISRI